MYGFLTKAPEPVGPVALMTTLFAGWLDLALPPRPLAVDRIESWDQFTDISQPAADLVANGRLAKWFADLGDPSGPRLEFINGNFTRGGVTPESARYHWSFAREVFGIPEDVPEFNRITYFTPGAKRYAAGVVHSYELAGRAEPVLGLQFYPQDVIAEEALLEVLRIIVPRITIPGANLAYVALGAQQTATRISADLADLGIGILPLDEILGSITYIPLNPGEAWGNLRVFPADHNDLRADDIAVLEELPLELSVVAGVLTQTVQDTNSHVNLKSKERNTPNAVLRDAGPTHPLLAPHLDQPVHLIVTTEELVIEPTTAEMVAAKLAERRNTPLRPLGWEPADELLTYAAMADRAPAEVLQLASRYGSKAANLGFLSHAAVLGRADLPGTPSGRLGYDLVPAGFGVPYQYYADFVAHPPNQELRDAIDDLVTTERAGAFSPRELAAKVEAVQAAFLSACFPPGQLTELWAMLDEALPGKKKLKIRSSANAEDIPGFDGAGLHDSYSARTKKKDSDCATCAIKIQADGDRRMDPRSPGCAVKGVYASLWNKRAVEERSFARIDQATVAMGLGIVAEYDSEVDIAANAVVITRVLNTDAVYGYSLSVQAGNNLVTNPDPGTHSEVTIAAFVDDTEPISFATTRYARPVRDEPPLTGTVLTMEAMTELIALVRIVERAYCAAKPDYYPGSCAVVTMDSTKPTSLDLEIKILENGHFVIKQVREFGGR